MEGNIRFRRTPKPSRSQRIRHQRALHVRLHAPAHDLTTEQIEHDSEVQPALVGCDVGDVNRAALVGCFSSEVALQQIQCNGQVVFAVHSDDKLFPASGLDAVLFHHAQYALFGKEHGTTHDLVCLVQYLDDQEGAFADGSGISASANS